MLQFQQMLPSDSSSTGPPDAEGEIALCTLSAINLGALESLDEMEELTELAVRALDSLLDYQDYPVEAARNSSMPSRMIRAESGYSARM